jgi:hypothetical protein
MIKISPIIISLHLPKTAGSSFGLALKEHFGDNLLRDYDDFPMAKPAFERNKQAILSGLNIAQFPPVDAMCIHGHFLPIKYLLLGSRMNLKFITWMRNPVDRLISHFYFWQRTYNPSEDPLPHHRKIIEEGWTLEQFCFSPEYRNFYTQYLWGFPIEAFDFIGLVDFFSEDLDYFSKKYIGTILRQHKLRVSNVCHRIDKDLRLEIEKYHQKDMNLYRQALEIRALRLACGSKSFSC